MTETLYHLSDNELNKIVALELAGYADVHGGAVWKETPHGMMPDGPVRDYSTDVNAILPLASKLSPDWSTRTVYGEHEVRVGFVGKHRGNATAVSNCLARAIVIALITAHRNESTND